MNVPEDLLYTKEHEWVLVEDEVGTLGITDYAQQELGDVVYVELPEVGATFAASEAFGSLESVKAVSEVYSPVGGEVLDTNESLNDSPEKINEDPYGAGWMVRIQIEDLSELDELMTSEEYRDYLHEEAGK